jgi:hypothetical protein
VVLAGTIRSFTPEVRQDARRCRADSEGGRRHPTMETGVEAMTLAVLSVFDQHAGGK